METKTVTVSLEVAELIEKVYLPTNPNKLRKAHPIVVQAVREFKAAVALANNGKRTIEN